MTPVADCDQSDEVRLAGTAAFGPSMHLAEAYADLLVNRGTQWGLLGPREAGRVWSRHLLNSAALAPLIGPDRSVADVGSGAGLPGIPLAIARPDLRITLIESLDRRARFLRLAVEELGLGDRVDVQHARAEQVRHTFATVVSRAVAPLSTLIPWCLKLADSPGEVLAMRGSRIEQEVADYQRSTTGSRRRTEIVLAAASGAHEPVRVLRMVT